MGTQAGDDLEVRPGLTLPSAEISETFSTSGGPGGQHANRSQTRVELRFDIAKSQALTEYQRSRLTEQFGNEVRVVIDEERSQLRNRNIARKRLAGRMRAALEPRRTRRPTRPTRGSKKRRLQAKRQRGEIKRNRQRPRRDEQ